MPNFDDLNSGADLDGIDFSQFDFDREDLGDPDFGGVDPEQAEGLPPPVLQAIRLRHQITLVQQRSVASNADSFVFRSSDGTFRTPDGEVVPSNVTRSAADVALKSSRERVEKLTRQLRDGEITLGRWQREMMNEIKDAHINMGSLAKGGYEQMGQADYGRVGRILRDEYEYLNNFAQQIADGDVPLDGKAVNRAGMYVDSARGTHHRVERLEMQKRGFNQEKNILGVAEHCPECVELTTRGDDGWVPNGTLPEIGDRICLANCKCQVVYRRTFPGEAVDPEPFPGNQA